MKRQKAGFYFVVISFIGSFGMLAASEANAAVVGCGEEMAFADKTDPLVVEALKMWDSIRKPVQGMTGLETSIRILSPSVTDSLYAEACTSKTYPPFVNISYPLLKKTLGDKIYPKELLAFVFAHELAHRITDISGDGTNYLTGPDIIVEKLADKRAAFYMSLGGYSPSSLKDQKLVREVLAKEFKVAGKSPEERQQNIEEVFRTIGAYEGLYETAMVLAYSGDLDQAARLISWADELIAGKDNVPIPELKIMHAIVRMMLAERDMPWTGETGLLPATKSKAGQLACIPVFPAHTTQWDSIRERGEEVRLQGVRAIEKTSKEKAMENLGIARLLLEKAENIVGADKLTIMGTRACVYFYMGEYETAGRTSDRAIKLAGKATDTARDALKSNAALIKFAVFASMDSEPGSGQKKTRDVWVSKLKARQKDFTANRDLKKLVSALIRGSDLAELKFSDDAQQTDTSKNTLKLPKYRASGIRMGECPEGWVFDNSVPTRDEKDTESKYGVTACRSKINNGERLVHVVLPQVSSPDYEETDMTVFISENPADQMGDIAIWRGNCGGKIKKTAVSDDGATVFRVACPKVNAPLGMIQVEDDKVTKVGMVE